MGQCSQMEILGETIVALMLLGVVIRMLVDMERGVLFQARMVRGRD